jgi:hypothetical protein
MAPGASTSTADYITKRIYLKGDLPSELVKRRHPLLGRMKRESCYFGEDARYPVKFSNPQSITGPFSTALTLSELAASSPAGYQFAMTEAEKHGRITVDSKSILKTKKNEASFVKLWRHATEGMIEEFSNRIAWNLYRDGTGVRGKVADVTGEVVTLAAGYYARDFEYGAHLQGDDEATGADVYAGTNHVVGVDLAANKITLEDASDINTGTGLADDDYLFYRNEAGSAYNLDGLEVHFPLAGPTAAESFRGTGNDRSVYPERLAGSRIDNTSATPESNIGLVAVRIHNNGGYSNCAYANSETVWDIAQRLGAKVQYRDYGGKVKYGYEYIQIHTPAGILDLYSDPDCPQNRAFVCDDGDLYICHADKLIHVIMDDGSMTTRMPADSGLEQRWRTVSQTKVLLMRNHGVVSV